jgi:tRNA (mo5U34)-methyltransferase
MEMMQPTQTELERAYAEDVERFHRRAYELGLSGAERFAWYHTIDLGDGLVTPGTHDYRRTIADFAFPEDLRGKQVLDVGSATGFFAFEFERRGASVVSVELPSLEALDRFPGQTTEELVRRIESMIWPDGQAGGHDREELYEILLDGAFRFCSERLDSKVERCFARVHDLGRVLAGRQFDLVFLGDLLVHVFDPLTALAAVAPLCRGTLAICQHLPEEFGDWPAISWVGGDRLDHDGLTWAWPNRGCFDQVLRKLGFREVVEVGRSRGVLRPSGHPFDRPVLNARR